MQFVCLFFKKGEDVLSHGFSSFITGSKGRYEAVNLHFGSSFLCSQILTSLTCAKRNQHTSTASITGVFKNKHAHKMLKVFCELYFYLFAKEIGVK